MQRAGFNLTPNHFYWPIPDFRQLDHRNWQALPLWLVSICASMSNCSAWSRFQQYRDEMHFPESASEDPTEFHVNNRILRRRTRKLPAPWFLVQAAPHQIEIGGGNSTQLCGRAVTERAGRFSGKLFQNHYADA